MTTGERQESATIEKLLRGDRTFPPPADFVANAIVNDPVVNAIREGSGKGED